MEPSEYEKILQAERDALRKRLAEKEFENFQLRQLVEMQAKRRNWAELGKLDSCL